MAARYARSVAALYRAPAVYRPARADVQVDIDALVESIDDDYGGFEQGSGTERLNDEFLKL